MLREFKHFTYLKFLHFFLKENAHVNFLFSMVLLVVLSPFLEQHTSGQLGVTLVATYNVLATMYFIIHNKRNYWVMSFSFFIILCEWLAFFGIGFPADHHILHYLEMVSTFGTAFIFVWALAILFSTIFYTKTVDINVIISSISGYLAMGILGAFGFGMLNQFVPDSFHMTVGEILDRHDMIYFSFVTMSTLGYGDIVPTGGMARGMAIILTLSGQMYMTMVIAMLIGKYMASNRD